MQTFSRQHAQCWESGSQILNRYLLKSHSIQSQWLYWRKPECSFQHQQSSGSQQLCQSDPNQPKQRCLCYWWLHGLKIAPAFQQHPILPQSKASFCWKYPLCARTQTSLCLSCGISRSSWKHWTGGRSEIMRFACPLMRIRGSCCSSYCPLPPDIQLRARWACVH
jgi:hypothetical protein